MERDDFWKNALTGFLAAGWRGLCSSPADGRWLIGELQ